MQIFWSGPCNLDQPDGDPDMFIYVEGTCSVINMTSEVALKKTYQAIVYATYLPYITVYYKFE